MSVKKNNETYVSPAYNSVCPEAGNVDPKNITRDSWVKASFPEWGRYLNYEIDNFPVPKGQVAMWWVSGSSWILKTDLGGIFLIDANACVSHSTHFGECGVCYQSGAPFINWMRLSPQYIDPWGYGRIDAYLMSHTHADHCDPYSIAGAAQCSSTKFYGPRVVAEKTRDEFGIPKERIVTAKVGDIYEFPGAKLHILPCYDETAIRTGIADKLLDYEECTVCFMFETSAGNILFGGDTWYNDAYVEVGEKYDIDVATFNMGFNALGATDKMTPYDAVRFGQAVKAKVLIPDHYNLFANIAGDPMLLVQQFERIAQEIAPEIKTVIMQGGGRFLYPADQDIKRYWYPNGSENYDFKNSAVAKQIASRRAKQKDK